MHYRPGSSLLSMWITFAVVLVSTLCSAIPNGGDAVYRNTTFLYQFQPPTGWEQKMDMPKQTVAFLGPIDNEFSCNLTVSVFTGRVKNSDLEKFVRGIKIEHGEISERKPCKLGGLPAYTWRTKLTIPEHPAAENRQVVCIYNNLAYELAFTTAPGLMRSKYDAVFDKWTASFVWLKPSNLHKQPSTH